MEIMSDESAARIKTALVCAKLAKSSLDMLGHGDLLVLRLQLKQVTDDYNVLAEHIAKLK
jgi:hypothetical protein